MKVSEVKDQLETALTESFVYGGDLPPQIDGNKLASMIRVILAGIKSEESK